VYGTYICNRRHSCPQSHICSFLVCPSHHREHSSKPEVSITVCDSQQARRQRRRVRFCDSGDFQITDQILYPLEQEIMDRMSAIKLDQAVWTGNTNKDTTVEKLSDTVNGMAITENTFQ